MANQAQPHFNHAKAHFDEKDYAAAQRELSEAIRLDHSEDRRDTAA